ncbi:hypothetical protein ECOK1180_1730 [Escherichia coli OK1180]|nr:hypothetical protein ECOK1180_1730 [Escherichia coli OK1180]
MTLKGVSPNNLGYLKLAINMENIQFDNLPSAKNRQKRSKKINAVSTLITRNSEHH